MSRRMNRARKAWPQVVVLALSLAVLAACGTSTVVRSSSASKSAAKPAVSQPRYGTTTQVQKGQTLYRIAVNNGITPLDLALWNNIPPPYTIYPGQSLRLYPPGSSRSVATTKPATTTTPPRAAATATQTPKTNTPAPAATPVPVAGNFNWRWPTDGQIVGTFAGGDATRQGIDIAGSSGQSVRAAADGTVVYSGAGLVGYGELIIIKHDEQWLSAYGHNRKRLVNEGQIVKAGQQIAEMGRSGASRDMLHFEIRYNGKPVNPQDCLPRK
ncbi:MAG: peptidoglycan DD-metalloendopeptidase family protein [Pseudoxanthomonas sp.]